MKINTDSLLFKVADEDWEFEQINRLNYETFVEEIPQHQANENRVLIDKFDHENTYLICLMGKQVIGMLAMRSKRPFSLDYKLPNLDSYLPKSASICEVRLLVVKKEYRHGSIFKGLVKMSREYGRKHGHNFAIISAIVSRLKLYKGLGFVPFAQVLGSGEASFQPMYLTDEQFDEQPIAKSEVTYEVDDSKINFLPGPVKIASEVRNALSKLPISHRSDEFMAIFKDTKQRICDLVHTQNVEIFNGSGTMANDVIAGQLLQLNGKGLILTNGEFGERLTKNAKGLNLNYQTYSLDWGTPFDLNEIEKQLSENKEISWLWLAHCETSTGMLNDLQAITQIAQKYDVKVAVDCISSVAVSHLNLEAIYLASITSGKGIASFAGLSMVCYNHRLVPPTQAIPRYFDLYYYSQCDGIPYTLPTNLVFALQQALKKINIEQRVLWVAELSKYLRQELERMNFEILLPQEMSSNAVITIKVPARICSQEIGVELEKTGILISFNSSYLVQRNWVQLCIMGNLSKKMIDLLLPVFRRFASSNETSK